MKRIVVAMSVVVLLAGLARAKEVEKVSHKLIYVRIKQSRQAILKNPADAGAHRALVRAYYLWKRMEEITTECENKLAEDPDNAVLTYALGLCHSYAGEKAKAVELYRKALTLDPDLGHPYYSLGSMAHHKNEIDAAKDFYQKAIERDPEIAEAHHNLGGIYLAQRAFGQAVEHLELAAELAPSDLGTLYNLGCAYVRAGMAEQAIDAFVRLEQLAPGELAASSMLAEAYNLKGLEAPEYLRRSANKHNEIGAKLLRRKKYKAAEQELLRAMEVDPGFSRPYNNLAWLYATAEEEKFSSPTRAVKLAKLAVELTEGKNWHCLDTLAEAYFATGQLELATESELKALKLARDNRYLKDRLARFREEAAKLEALEAEKGEAETS